MPSRMRLRAGRLDVQGVVDHLDIGPDETLGDADGLWQFHQIDEDITVWRHGKTTWAVSPSL